MPFVDLESLAADHVQRLSWFVARAGATTRWPAPLPGDQFLVTRPKGIFKPRDLNVALSIRIQLDSPYHDGAIYCRDNGSWYFAYHQEKADPAERDNEYTNRSLMQCIKERMPVGVLRERVPDNINRDTYDILGLAVPVRWESGYFYFEGVRPDGYWHAGDTAADLLLADAESLESDGEPTEALPDDYDARVRTTRQIVARRGQKKFRTGLLDAYEGRCAVTGTEAEAVLEAAHIRPYRGVESNVLTNGLLLRADIHTLFDLALLAIEPGCLKVSVSKTLEGTRYSGLQGKVISVPASDAQAPSSAALWEAWSRFEESEGSR